MKSEGEATNPEVLGEGRFLRLVSNDGWEYVTRRRGTDVVGIVAVTDQNELILVRQHRMAVAGEVLELPAGLVGDESDGETALAAAKRELEEETGFTCERVEPLTRGASSAGLTDEQVLLVRAWKVRRIGEGGGVGGEQITVVTLPLHQAREHLLEVANNGGCIDFKVWAALAFLA